MKDFFKIGTCALCKYFKKGKKKKTNTEQKKRRKYRVINKMRHVNNQDSISDEYIYGRLNERVATEICIMVVSCYHSPMSSPYNEQIHVLSNYVYKLFFQTLPLAAL